MEESGAAPPAGVVASRRCVSVLKNAVNRAFTPWMLGGRVGAAGSRRSRREPTRGGHGRSRLGSRGECRFRRVAARAGSGSEAGSQLGAVDEAAASRLRLFSTRNKTFGMRNYGSLSSLSGQLFAPVHRGA